MPGPEEKTGFFMGVPLTELQRRQGELLIKAVARALKMVQETPFVGTAAGRNGRVSRNKGETRCSTDSRKISEN